MSFQASFVGVLILGLIWKLILLAGQAFPFNADEAIVGLMGRHILEGARPIFFYGQAYMGSLDAYLVALGFKLFGSEVWVIRIIQSVLFLGTLATTMRLALFLHNDKIAALISGLLLAIPTVNFTLYTTVSLGGYGEALLIGNLLLITTVKIHANVNEPTLFLFWGLLAGAGFWAFGLTLIYIIPCALALIFSFRRERWNARQLGHLGYLVLGLLIGSIPLSLWVAQHGAAELVQELLGSAIAGISSLNYWGSVGLHLKNFLIFGLTVILGFRPPWTTGPLAIPLLPLALSFWLAVLVHAILRRKRASGQRVLGLIFGTSLVLLTGFALTPFGGDPSGRYFLPLMIPLALMAGEFVRRPMFNVHRSLRWILLCGVLAFNLFSTWQAAQTYPDRITTQFDPVARVDHRQIEELIRFLQEKGESYGYSNYWISYPLAFLSDEQLIFYPALPYHQDFRYTERDNRYPYYKTAVDASPQGAFITTNHPGLDDLLRRSLESLGVTWQEQIIGNYVIFYQLSEKIDIQEVGQRWLRGGS